MLLRVSKFDRLLWAWYFLLNPRCSEFALTYQDARNAGESLYQEEINKSKYPMAQIHQQFEASLMLCCQGFDWRSADCLHYPLELAWYLQKKRCNWYGLNSWYALLLNQGPNHELNQFDLRSLEQHILLTVAANSDFADCCFEFIDDCVATVPTGTIWLRRTIEKVIQALLIW